MKGRAWKILAAVLLSWVGLCAAWAGERQTTLLPIQQPIPFQGVVRQASPQAVTVQTPQGPAQVSPQRIFRVEGVRVPAAALQPGQPVTVVILPERARFLARSQGIVTFQSSAGIEQVPAPSVPPGAQPPPGPNPTVFRPTRVDILLHNGNVVNVPLWAALHMQRAHPQDVIIGFHIQKPRRVAGQEARTVVPHQPFNEYYASLLAGISPATNPLHLPPVPMNQTAQTGFHSGPPGALQMTGTVTTVQDGTVTIRMVGTNGSVYDITVPDTFKVVSGSLAVGSDVTFQVTPKSLQQITWTITPTPSPMHADWNTPSHPSAAGPKAQVLSTGTTALTVTVPRHGGWHSAWDVPRGSSALAPGVSSGAHSGTAGGVGRLAAPGPPPTAAGASDRGRGNASAPAATTSPGRSGSAPGRHRGHGR